MAEQSMDFRWIPSLPALSSCALLRNGWVRLCYCHKDFEAAKAAYLEK